MSELEFFYKKKMKTGFGLYYKLNHIIKSEIRKSLKGNSPLTRCNISQKGTVAFKVYVNPVSSYFKAFKTPE